MNPWTDIVGWTLIHFVWQGTVLALGAAGALRLCRRRSANARYAIACTALAIMLASPLATASVLLVPRSPNGPGVSASPAAGTPEPPSLVPLHWTSGIGLSTEEIRAYGDVLLPPVVFAWLTGVTVLLVRMGGGLWHIRRLQRLALATPPSSWQHAAARIGARLRMRTPVHVIESHLIDTPIALGWLRPVVLLPIAALAHLTPCQVEAIIAHELVHIRRHDYLINIAQTLAETLLFFHPGVWWVSGQVCAEREHCCDDVVVHVCGDPVEYVAALAELELWRSRGATLALAASQGSLIGRVRRLLDMPLGHEPPSMSWVMTLTLSLVLAVAAGSVYVSSTARGVAPEGVPAPDQQRVEAIASPDTFDWRVHRTDHFDIHYYPTLAPGLEQVAASAERAYERVNTTLQYSLPFRVPLVLFKTRGDFAQQQIVPGLNETIASEDVAAFSEPEGNRIVLLVEEDPDRLYRLITHELTHIFAFDIIPRSRTNARRVASWLDEGFADYMTGVWDADRLRELREIVAAGTVPAMSTVTGRVEGQSWPATVSLGHSVFDFIEAEYGRPGVWQFLLEVRRYVVDGTGDPYRTTFGRSADEFDAAFAEYLRRRFSI